MYDMRTQKNEKIEHNTLPYTPNVKEENKTETFDATHGSSTLFDTFPDKSIIPSTSGVDFGQSHRGAFPTREAHKPFVDRQPSLVINPVSAVHNPRAEHAFPPGRPPSSGYEKQQGANVAAGLRRSRPSLLELWKDIQGHEPKGGESQERKTKEVSVDGGSFGASLAMQIVEPDMERTAVIRSTDVDRIFGTSRPESSVSELNAHPTADMPPATIMCARRSKPEISESLGDERTHAPSVSAVEASISAARYTRISVMSMQDCVADWYSAARERNGCAYVSTQTHELGDGGALARFEAVEHVVRDDQGTDCPVTEMPPARKARRRRSGGCKNCGGAVGERNFGKGVVGCRCFEREGRDRVNQGKTLWHKEPGEELPDRKPAVADTSLDVPVVGDCGARGSDWAGTSSSTTPVRLEASKGDVRERTATSGESVTPLGSWPAAPDVAGEHRGPVASSWPTPVDERDLELVLSRRAEPSQYGQNATEDERIEWTRRQIDNITDKYVSGEGHAVARERRSIIVRGMEPRKERLANASERELAHGGMHVGEPAAESGVKRAHAVGARENESEASREAAAGGEGRTSKEGVMVFQHAAMVVAMQKSGQAAASGKAWARTEGAMACARGPVRGGESARGTTAVSGKASDHDEGAPVGVRGPVHSETVVGGLVAARGKEPVLRGVSEGVRETVHGKTMAGGLVATGGNKSVLEGETAGVRETVHAEMVAERPVEVSGVGSVPQGVSEGVRETMHDEAVAGALVAVSEQEPVLEGASVGMRGPAHGEMGVIGQVIAGETERTSMGGLLAFQRVSARGERHSSRQTTASGMAQALAAGMSACSRVMVGGRESAVERGTASGTKSGKQTLRQILAARDAELAKGLGVRKRIAGGEAGKVRIEMLTRAAGPGMTLRPTLAATEYGQAAEQVAGRVQAQSQTGARMQELTSLQEAMQKPARLQEGAGVQGAAQDLTRGQLSVQAQIRVQVAAQEVIREQTRVVGAGNGRVEEERAWRVATEDRARRVRDAEMARRAEVATRAGTSPIGRVGGKGVSAGPQLVTVVSQDGAREVEGILPTPARPGSLELGGARRDMFSASALKVSRLVAGAGVRIDPTSARAEPVTGRASGGGALRPVVSAVSLMGQAVKSQAGPKREGAVSPRFKRRVEQVDCQPDTSEKVTVTVRVGGSELSVPVSRKAVEEAGHYPGTAAGTVRRAISTCLRDVLGFDSLTRILLRLDYILQGTVLYEELVPEDFEQLRFFVSRGGSCRTGARLCGGMDREAREEMLKGQSFDENTPYDRLDTLMHDIRSNVQVPESPPPEYRLAQALLDDYTLGQWEHLAAVIREHGLVGKVSPSRLAVLRYTALRAYENGGTLGLLPDMAVPKWVNEGNVVGIRVNDVAPKALFPSGSPEFVNQSVVKDAIIRGIVAAVPGLAQDHAYDRSLMDSEIQIDGNTKELVGLLSVTVVIPTGSSDSRSWVTDLLTGKLQIWPGSYVTLDPVGPFAEITPSARDNILVKAIGVALDVPYLCFLKLLNTAFSRAYNTQFSLVRYTTSKSTGKGKDRVVQSFGPEAEESSLRVGLSVLAIIMTGRSAARVTLALGPVELSIDCSQCPHHVLKELVGPGAEPPFLQIGQGGPQSPMIMFAPLPKDWLAKLVGRNKAKRFDELLAIKRCCQQHLGVLDVGFVGKREKSQDAFALVLEFRVVDQARQFYTALSPGGEAFHADVIAVFQKVFAGVITRDMVYSCLVPHEALTRLGEKDLKALLAKARQSGPDNPPQA